MQDADGSVPFFWGSDSEGNLVLSDDVQIVQKGCGKSFAPFPKGKLFYSGLIIMLVIYSNLSLPLFAWLNFDVYKKISRATHG